MTRFSCPTCKTILQATDEQAGATIACPKCKTQMRAPTQAQAVPVPPPRPASTPTASRAAAMPPPPPPMPKAAQGNPKATTAPVGPPPLPPAVPANNPGSPWWKRLLHEVKEIGVATWGLTCRCAHYATESWKGRALRRACTDAQVALGERLNEQKVGNSQIQAQIAALYEQIRQAEATKQSSSAFKTQRRSLILQLAAPALGRQAVPHGAAAEHQKATDAKATVERYEEDMKLVRAFLPPRDSVGWRRVGIGYGMAGCMFVLGLILVVGGRGWHSAPDGSALSAKLSESPKVQLQDIADPKSWDLVGTIVCQARRSYVDGIILSPDGRRLLIYADGYPPQLHDLLTGQSRPIPSELYNSISTLFSPNGSHLVFLRDKDIVIWNIDESRIERTLDKKVLSLADHESMTLRSFIGSGTKLATAVSGRQQRVILWDFPSFNKLWEVPGDGPIAVSSDSKVLACQLPGTATIVMRDVGSGNEISRIELPLRNNRPNVLALTPDGKRLAVCYNEIEILVYDLVANTEMTFLRNRGLPDGSRAPRLTSMAMSSNGKRLAVVGGDSGFACIWDIERDIVTLLPGHHWIVEKVAYSAKGGILVTAAGDRSVRIWQGRAGRKEGKFRPMAWNGQTIQEAKWMWRSHSWGVESPGSSDPKRSVVIKGMTLFFSEDRYRNTIQQFAEALDKKAVSVPVNRLYIDAEGPARFNIYVGFNEKQRKNKDLCKKVAISLQETWWRVFPALPEVFKIAVCDEMLTTTYASVLATNDLSKHDTIWKICESEWQD